MGCSEPESIPYEEMFPQENKDMRKLMASIAMAQAKQSATPYPRGTPVAAGMNSAKKNALNLMGVMSTGKPYTSSKPATYGSLVTETLPEIKGDEPGDNRGWECALHSPPLRFLTEDLYNAHMRQVHGTGPGDDPITDDPKDRPIDVRSRYFDPYSQDSWM